MKTHIQVKLLILGILLFFNIGFLANFHKYNLVNRLFCSIFFLVTLLFIVYVFWDINKRRKKTMEDRDQEAKAIQALKSGVIPRLESSSLIMKEGEFASFECPTHMTIVKNKLVGSTGNSGGVSVRVAKGLYLRSGSFGSRKIYKDMYENYPGNFIVTNKRVVFLNPQKGFEIPYTKLTSVYSRGRILSLQSQNKGYSIFLSSPTVIETLIHTLAQQK